MIANVSAHRRANAFARALEESGPQPPDPDAPSAEPGRSTGEQTAPPELGRMLTLANGLTALPRPALDPDVRTVQRAQLVAAMEAMLRDGTGGEATDPSVPEQRTRTGTKGAHRAGPLRKLRPRTRLTKGLAAGGLTVTVAAGAFGGVAAASGDALPGDTLYGLKRGMEDVKRSLADGDSDRGELYLDQASTRLSEARRLMDRGRSGHLDHESVAEVRRTLNGMRHDAAEGHRLLLAAYERDGSLGPIQSLSSFSRAHRESWSALRDSLPVQLGDVSAQVTSVFDAMEHEVDPLRSLLPRPPAPSDPAGTGPTTGHVPSTAPSEGTGSSASPGPGDGREGTGDAERGTGGAEDARTRPSPSASGESADKPGKGEGLIGSGTGGLLDPDRSPDGPSPSGKASTDPEPDVTLPPLLPGLIPGLGIDGENAGP
ncbi:DUF5667 domain-containing protein [Streptomyces sp. LE64]|uniref:DUF5667 domain-containing protein n=1 Tax=Streptomyces sp. LE64 TaxID=3448653 RepID=UPI00404330DA